MADLDFSADNSILKNFAVEKSNLCKDLLSSNLFDEAIELFGLYDLGPLHYSEAEIKNRLTDSRFWLRRIRRQQSAIICQIERSLGYVSKRKAVYCGDVSLNNRRVQQAKSQQFMESTLLQNDEGLTVSLAEIASHTISNPVIRRHELMVRIRGFEEVAQLCGHSAVFVTITTPSRMHVTKASGKANPAFDGSTIQEAQYYLNHLWQMCRAKLDRDQLKPYGFRVVEPHHDGTPHWHLLLFMPPEQLAPFKKAINRYALLDSPDEKGAEQHRVKFIDIDPAKGSAAGYIAKYIAKNIDGFAVGTDTSGNKSTEMAERINAWAKASQIRQFQQIGGPSVTVWRELRRIKQCNTPFFDLNEAHAAADSSNWAAFCLAMNSVGTIKKEHLLSPYYDIKPSEQVDYQTGEVIRLQLNQYQEQRKAVLLGLHYGSTRLKTRITTWRRQTAPPSEGVPPAGAGNRRAVETWTCVNNCTDD